jgi:hypothetical protein
MQDATAQRSRITLAPPLDHCDATPPYRVLAESRKLFVVHLKWVATGKKIREPSQARRR